MHFEIANFTRTYLNCTIKSNATLKRFITVACIAAIKCKFNMQCNVSKACAVTQKRYPNSKFKFIVYFMQNKCTRSKFSIIF